MLGPGLFLLDELVNQPRRSAAAKTPWRLGRVSHLEALS